MHAQSSDELRKKAEERYEAKNFEEAATLYEQAALSAEKKQAPVDLYNASCSYALHGNEDKAIQLLLSAAESGWDDAQTIRRDTDLDILRKRNDWNQILAQVYEKMAVHSKTQKGLLLFKAAQAWAKASENDKAIRDLELSIRHGGLKLEMLQNEMDLQHLHDDPRWNMLLSDLKDQLIKEKSNFFWGIYFGLLFFIIIYNLFTFISLKEYAFLFYSMFIFFYVQFEAQRTPTADFYLTDLFFWLKYMRPASALGMFLPMLAVLFLLLFTKTFLGLKDHTPRINKWLNRLLYFFAFLLPFSYCFDVLNKLIVFPSILLIYSFCLGIGIYRLINGFRPARFFVIGMAALTLTVFWVILASFDILPEASGISVFHIDNIGTIIFSLILSLAIGDKVIILKSEKESAQEKALEVLEEKVQERTIELKKEKEIVEEKQKEILDSIRYAKRIQSSLLPTEKFIDRTIRRLSGK